MSYTTAADVIDYAGIPAPTAADTILLEAMIDAAQVYIDGYCRQTFEVAADSTRYFDPCRDVDGRTLYFDAPLIAITSVTNGDGVLIAPTAYVTEPRNLTPWFGLTLKSNSGLSWTYGGALENSIAIAGKWAYSLVPDAGIVQISKELVAYYWRQKDREGDADRAALAGNSTLIPATIPADITDKLDQYRRLVI